MALNTHAPSLELLDSFLRVVEDASKDEPDMSSSRLISVLQVYRCHLRRYQNHRAATSDELQTLKTGVRTAELLLHGIADDFESDMVGWHPGGRPATRAQRFSNMLWEITMQLTVEIQANEALYPELKSVFDHERAKYRVMLAEAHEAEAL